MEELEACGSCRQPMHRAAVRCPRCSAFQRRFASQPEVTPKGYRDADRAPETAKVIRDASPMTVRARRQEEQGELPDDPGVFAGLLLPDPRTRGLVRAIEIALTIAAQPLIGSALFGLLLLLLASLDLPWKTGHQLRAPAWMFRALGIVMGVPVLFIALEGLDVPRETSAIIVALQLVAISGRTALRRAALAPRRRRLDLDG